MESQTLQQAGELIRRWSSGSFRLPKELLSKYKQFHLKEIPLETLVFLMVLVTTFVVNSVLGMSYITPEHRVTSLYVSFIGGVLSCIIGWAFIFMRFVSKRSRPSSEGEAEAVAWFKWTHWLQNAFLLLLTIFLGMRLYAKVRYGQCRTDRLAEDLYCNRHSDTDGLPLEAFLALILVPMLYSSIMRDTDWNCIIASWIFSNVFLLFASYRDYTREKLTVWVYYFLLSGLLLYSNQKQNIRSFIVQQQLASVIKQNKELAEELRANELRHMIGNVAHDLKTPLASFVSGLDMIADIAKDGMKKLANSDALSTNQERQELRDVLQSVVVTVGNSRNINNFMMMTINRCIDYTKATKGLKLVPKYETIDLMETLALPFRCMRDVSQRVQITFEPIDPSICSHIITDKQWLQENILCLLSNAVKYSAGGVVNARVVLMRSQFVGAGQRTCHSIFQATNDTNIQASRSHDPPLSSSASEPGLAPEPPSELDDELIHETKVRPSTVTSHLLWSRVWARYFSEKSAQNKRSIRKIVVTGSSDRSKAMMAASTSASTMLTAPSQSSPSLVHTMDTAALYEAPPSSAVEGNGQGPSMLVVEVEDTGIGMTEESMATLFNAFRQAQRLAGGTGLGLFSLARRIEALGGTYGVRKRSDGVQGSLFWFSLPYRPDEVFASLMPSSSSSSSSTSVVESTEYPKRPSPREVEIERPLPALSISLPTKERVLNILIVDDSASIQKMMSTMLRRHGHHVDQADHGADAVSLITAAYQSRKQSIGLLESTDVSTSNVPCRTPYDVVLMDLQMPVMDGLEAMRRIRTLERSLSGSESFGGVHDISQSMGLNSPKTSLPRDEDSPQRSLHLDGNHHTNAENQLDALHDISLHQLIIGVSANSDTDTMEEALAAGADTFISKPFSVDSFYTIYDKCLQRRMRKP